MAASIDERNRILHMVETGKVTAAQAAQLLDMLALEQPHSDERSQKRMVRVRVTNLTNNRQKANVVIPVSLIQRWTAPGNTPAPAGERQCIRRPVACYCERCHWTLTGFTGPGRRRASRNLY